MNDEAHERDERLTLYQRLGRRALRRKAGRAGGEPLRPEDWKVAWSLHDSVGSRALHRLLFALPSSPRCAVCGAPFEGIGARLARPLGYRPSRKNPVVCSVCVEFAPPGGMNMHTGVLFADLRGFTSRFEDADPQAASLVLRRFYRCAEDVLFPDAVIDKLIGDAVMALYLPDLRRMTREQVPDTMLAHARGLLREVGYGTPEGPFVEVGVGLDVGEAFVGNIGQRALYDFTAIGDVVNTASRLEGCARGGEIVLSDRVAQGLTVRAGERIELELKGKSKTQAAYRVAL